MSSKPKNLDEMDSVSDDEGLQVSDASTENSDRQTDSEISVSSSRNQDESSTDNDPQFLNNENVLLGKNNYKWSKIPPATKRTRACAHNLVAKLPGLTGDARVHNPKTPSESWRFLIDKEIIECVLHNTNEKITILASKSGSKNLDYQYTQHSDIAELGAFFGLLYLAGVFKFNHEDTRSLFAMDGIGHYIFRATTSKN
ncbi:hypothetical protein PR048_011099 [Dryococelus australis]|uniref:PiggyBac transposable element-derived protein domain-containing protein n=1 Tax=Dryococelus australis TaxID=614101 RepID=A0ABQ9HLX4_9NEOP|nr:hypothetical protein PR048_011099 [Dryococelus australis]